jgi:hypothetical protein
VTGYLRKTPSLRIVGRRGNVLDSFGKILPKSFIAIVIQKTLVECGTKSRSVLLTPDEDSAGRRYISYVEGTLPSYTVETSDRRLRATQQSTYCRE